MYMHVLGGNLMATRVVRMAMTQARVNLGSLVRAVRVEKDIVVLEKDGIPVAGLIDIDALDDYLELTDPALRRRIKANMKAYHAGRGRPARAFLAELKREKSH
jgi:PHD/YefM family antitoxin component YafN of YafNO toxin-antitoxin module